MNNHARSFSLQPSSQVSATSAGSEPQSYIRFHSDSQQSLDQLFNPSQSAAKPLRHRNLPASFFKQNLNENATSQSNLSSNGRDEILDGPHINNYHERSISNPGRLNLHMATRSTPAPMPRVLSNQSSREVLNYDQNIVNNRTNMGCSHHNQDHNHPHNHCPNSNGNLSNGWSSVSSTDNLTPANNWVAGQPQSPITAVPVQHQHQLSVAPTHQNSMMHQRVNFAANRDSPMQSNNTSQNIPASGGTYQIQHPHNHCQANNIHTRSISGLPIQPARSINVTNVHPMRGQNISAPMQGLNIADSHASSHQSSHEFLNHTNSMNHTNVTGWSSSGYSTDDLNSGWSTTNGSTTDQQQFAQQATPVLLHQQQVAQHAPATAMVVHSHPQHTIVHHHLHNQHDPQHHHTHVEHPHHHQHHPHVMHSAPHQHNHIHAPMQQVEATHVHPHHHPHHHHHHPHSHHHHHHQAPQQVFYNA